MLYNVLSFKLTKNVFGFYKLFCDQPATRWQ